MISVGAKSELAPDVVRSMQRLRHETFVERLRWSLPLLEGVEQDEFDTDDTVYFIVHDVDEDVTACARILPTTKPYMLTELFAELLGGRAPPHDAAVWELSRFATSVRHSGTGRVLALSSATLNLLEAVFQFGRDNGIRRLVLVTSTALERLLLRARLDIERLGAPVQMVDGCAVALAVAVPDHPRTDVGPRRPVDPALAARARRIELLYAQAHFGAGRW